jgi:hypothetical protein
MYVCLGGRAVVESVCGVDRKTGLRGGCEEKPSGFDTARPAGVQRGEITRLDAVDPNYGARGQLIEKRRIGRAFADRPMRRRRELSTVSRAPGDCNALGLAQHTWRVPSAESFGCARGKLHVPPGDAAGTID